MSASCFRAVWSDDADETILRRERRWGRRQLVVAGDKPGNGPNLTHDGAADDLTDLHDIHNAARSSRLVMTPPTRGISPTDVWLGRAHNVGVLAKNTDHRRPAPCRCGVGFAVASPSASRLG